MRAERARSEEAHRGERRFYPPYEPPDPSSVHVIDLAELLGGARTISDAQQQRLGFAPGKESRKLWCVGDLALVQRKCVAIVGTREASELGAARAARLARELVEAGVVVVSGAARGIDTHALAAAIDAGGRVIAVIGTPIEQATPAENRRLHEEIYRHHLLVSPFPPGSLVLKTNFPERNKVMAALTDATVIVEASDGSGTLHQAAECTRLGRWLFIAQSVLEDPSVSWPRGFKNYDRMRALTNTADVLAVIE